MNNEEQMTNDLQKLIRDLSKLPPNVQDKVAKAGKLIMDGDLVIPDAVDKLTNGNLTRDQFFEVIENQYQLLQM